ncbi:N-acetylmuramoyl-L-alanine amidase [Beijerinckiaceae bacterium RH AL1]|nr:N-acetylmuramoyl-L-alanine amidase [Beijerinckiaceae bacterium RH CH11]VVB45470.1 N-acetylmuramoyl-L-alanine amidase [Beijerinckiaceae bacterium RH AL8]VVC54843.1 N-acetylmuramoyl-L-alanine amidase [Beijerinckiaceae bacterium RH AL1]
MDRKAGTSLYLAALAALAILATPAAAAGLVGGRAAHAASQPVDVSPVDVTSASLTGGPDKAELSFDLSAPVAPTAYVVADPDRVIVELPDTVFSAPQPTSKPTSRRHHRQADLVASYRFGLVGAARSRIVVDLAAPAKIASAAIVQSAGHPRLVVSLARTDVAGFRAAARAHALVAAAPAPAVEPVAAPGLATIVLDAGHGGPDTGAIVNGVVEKDVTLAFANALAAKLRAHGGFNVVMTRDTDVFVPLAGRVQVARDAKAALMVSVHADTLPETADVSGATVYTVSDRASDAYAAKVAAKENAADAAAGGEGQGDTADINDILFDLTRQETRAYSHVFARTLVNYWKVAGRLNKNPQRAAGFVVLKAPDVPSVLLELGYLSNPGDAADLTADAWRDKASGRMAEAIESYFADRNGPAKAAAGVPMPLRQAAR